MLRINIDQIKLGSIIAEDIVNNQGVVLLSRGAVFNEEVSHYLDGLGIFEALVEEEKQKQFQEVKNIYFNDEDAIIDAYNKYMKSGNIDEVMYQKTKKSAIIQMKKVMVKLKTMGKINIDKVKEVVENIMEELLNQKDIVLTLSRLRSIDDYTYEHSVNVCILSLLVGIDMGLNKESLRNLGIGSILHDIGKIVISEDILKKPSRLSIEEYNQVKKHANYGYEILKNADIPQEAAIIALNHHEKFDGSGYDNGLKDKEAQLFSRIVSLTDTYDAMSNDRIYKKKKMPDKIYFEILSLSGSHFDPYLVSIFLNRIDIYPNGTGVVLNTNQKGVVIGQNIFYPEMPIVRLFKKEVNCIKINFTDIDLKRTNLITILDTF